MRYVAIRLFFALSVMLLLLAILAVGNAARAGTTERRDDIAMQVACPEWAALRSDNGDRVWRASAAHVEFYTGWRRVSGDVSGDCPELWHTLEWTCGAEYGAGVDTPFANEPVTYLVTHLGED